MKIFQSVTISGKVSLPPAPVDRRNWFLGPTAAWCMLVTRGRVIFRSDVDEHDRNNEGVQNCMATVFNYRAERHR
jgi:hypothetical protein